eukprot:CAMPEP_0185796350 /NCGR_PEP_ID=MMETSP1174-20130828/161033_1 /TAXON_ID=35687 /ORGANISM="Dictyocha speculum, Strain CCMP1381" /LENGTH=96 /DNA_ID=CAMNT_0028491705 /DNA_START=750 /DNA_END=1037 /DNA_ORIENTATION=+
MLNTKRRMHATLWKKQKPSIFNALASHWVYLSSINSRNVISTKIQPNIESTSEERTSTKATKNTISTEALINIKAGRDRAAAAAIAFSTNYMLGLP